MKLAVIPARGGSKRIPRKNIRAFAGRPIITWSIAAARDSGLFDRVIVSTDDEEIATVARAAGAEVPFVRPAELADDHATTGAVMAHAVTALPEAEAACCIYPTAPFLRPADLMAAERRFGVGAWDYVFSAVRFAYPPQRGLSRTNDGGTAMLHPELADTRSQDLPAVYHDAGQYYWGAADAWRKRAPIFGARSSFTELSAWRVQDIDTPEDWRKAEYLFEIVNKDDA